MDWLVLECSAYIWARLDIAQGQLAYGQSQKQQAVARECDFALYATGSAGVGEERTEI